MRVETAFARMQECQRHPYLEKERALPEILLGRERFAGRIRMDARGNAVFPHFDQEGLCRYEIKNSGFTGFAAGGSKGLRFSHARPDDNRLVFCESGIDALSHAALFPDDQARYSSIGGQVNLVHPTLLGRHRLECLSVLRLWRLWTPMLMGQSWLVLFAKQSGGRAGMICASPFMSLFASKTGMTS